MRSFTVDGSNLTAEYGIAVGRWSQFEQARQFPFEAMWCVIPAASRSAPDQHAEVELAIVVGGRARFVVEGRDVEAPAGTAVLLEPQERHVIHNTRDDEPVQILSVYWLPGERPPVEPAEDAAPVTVVLSPPPTPNGPLHLGHLAGPYVAADVAVRAARLRGEPVVSVCGLDDHQNYVPAAARAAGRAATELRDEYAGRIRDVLARVGVHHDVFVEPLTDTGYRQAVLRLLGELVEKGTLPVRERTVPVCEPCGGILHHAYVSGRCPHCKAAMGGGTCEGCGGFSSAAELTEPRCTRCGAEPSGTAVVRGPVLPLADHREALQRIWGRAVLPPAVRALTDRLLRVGLPTIPFTYPTDWGIEVPGDDGHRLDVWAEMGLGYLHTVGRRFDPSAVTLEQHVRAWDRVGGLWAFLGIDNAFYYAVLFPALLTAAGVRPETVAGLVVNEFYTLDGEKFSTSRQHAVWAEDLLARYPAELVRAYLCWDRPQEFASDFRMEQFRQVVDGWPRPLTAASLTGGSLTRAAHALRFGHFAADLSVRCLLTGDPGATGADPEAAGALLGVLTGVDPT
ncbi:class I tRNA ligase family protein [Actinoplanes siamensis]|uniref:Methionyl-tRNA synthetase n=1 Tax=Actinoplanes siamensis TaxID=1223317 RepID=A0A919TLY7_9ACTN|nr:class I tRNA ligase family protein [Actinoplanes siamensis]GIF07102.1 hypothetical protein Asi03nite_46400 [Actinoplanes siamensis]